MSELVLKWLNADVGLSRNVERFEADFANGFLLGELLHKHGFIRDFSKSFVDDNSYGAKNANFSHLKAALRGPAGVLGVQLGDEQAVEIMSGDRGSSLRLLFQIRKGLENAGASGAGRTGALRRKEEETQPPPPRDARGVEEERFFATRLKALKPSERRVAHELHSKPFVDEQTRQMVHSAEVFARDVKDRWDRSQSFRASQQMRMQDSRAAKHQVTSEATDRWRATLQRKVDSVGKDLRFEKEMIKREYQRECNVRERHQRECGYMQGADSQGIGWFERNLDRLGIDTSEHAGSSEAAIEAANPKELYEKMQELLPAKAKLQVESNHHMQRIRDTKKTGDLARKEREQRQRRAQVEQQTMQATAEERRSEESLLAWLAKEAAEARAEAMAYDQCLRYKEAARFQRQTRQEDTAAILAERSEKATAELVKRSRREREVTLEARQRSSLAHGSAGEMQEACGVLPLLDTDSSDEDEAESELQACPLTVGLAQSRTPSHERRARHSNMMASPVAPAVEPKELLDCVKEPSMYDYLFVRGKWAQHQPAQEDVRAFIEQRADLASSSEPSQRASEWQPRLGGLVRWLCTPDHTSGERSAELPADYLPVIAVTGTPVGLGASGGVAGKIARRFCEEFQLALVEPQAVIEECMALAQAQEPEEEWPVLACMRQLGRGFLGSLQSCQDEHQETSFSPIGGCSNGPSVAIPHEQFAEMLFRKIELISAPPPKPVEEEEPLDPKKKKAPAKKGKKEEEDTPPARPNGIVIAGFPTELADYVAWESALRGYTSPLLRILDSEEDLQAQLSAILAPWWQKPGLGNGAEAETFDMAHGLEVTTAIQHPMRVLRLCHPDRAALHEAILRQVAEEHAQLLDSASPAPPSRGSVPGGKAQGRSRPENEEAAEPTPAMLAKVLACEGYELEQGNHVSPVDSAWLYDEVQVLAQAFDRPVGCCHVIRPEVTVSALSDVQASTDGTGETLEDACYRQARELLLQWRGPKGPDGQEPSQQDVAAAPPSADQGAASEALTAAGIPQGPAGAGAQPASRPSTTGAATGTALWSRLRPQARTRLRNQWLDCMRTYFKELQATLNEVQTRGDAYCRELVHMQRNFLEFLQRNDDKGSVMIEFIKTWPSRSAGCHPGTQGLVEQLEDLSDRLWQHTDQRRAEAIQERMRLMEGGFWEEQAAACLKLTEKLQGIEKSRFQTSSEILSEAYCTLPPPVHRPSHPGEPDGLSSLRELAAWLRCLTEHLAGDPVQAEAETLAVDDKEESSAQELQNALLAEQVGILRRLRTLESWTGTRLGTMRKQLDETFCRMDDWIRDRVKAENDGIKAAVEQVRVGDWSQDSVCSSTLLRSPTSSRLSRTPKFHRSSSVAATQVRKRRRELLVTLEARPLLADVYQPTDPDEGEVASPPATTLKLLLPPEAVQGTYSYATSCLGMGPKTPTFNLGNGDRKASVATGCRWSQEMLSSLLEGLTQRSGGKGMVTEAVLLEELLARRNETLSLRSELVPQGWVTRSEYAYQALCQSLVLPCWGCAAVDVTELLLTLTLHGRPISWPSLAALEATRTMLVMGCGLGSAGADPAFPDVAISEATFMQLPLWDEAGEAKLQEETGEQPREMRRWLFQVLLRLEVETPPGGAASSRDSESTVSARRLFAYFGMGETPVQGFKRAMKLLMPTPPPADRPSTEEEIKPPEVRVRDLWTVLFSRGARPDGVAASAPQLADFCKEILPPPAPLEPDAVPEKPRAKSKPGSKKASVDPVGQNAAALMPPAPPEEVTVPMTAPELERHPAVLRGLCSHGGLLCRRRALAMLFSEGSPTPRLVRTAESTAARGLCSLIPPPPDPGPEEVAKAT